MPDKSYKSRMNRLFTGNWPCFAVTAIILIAIVAMWTGLFVQLRLERERVIAGKLEENDKLARLFEEHVARTIRVSELVAREIAAEYQRHGSRFNLAPFVKERGIYLDPTIVLSIIDDKGKVVLAAPAMPVPSLNVSDNANYQYHAANDSTGVFISAPRIGATSGRMTVYLSVRMNKPDGAFAGLSALGLDPSYFSNLYRALNRGKDSTVSLIGRDGIVRVHEEGSEVSTGTNLSNTTLFTQRLLRAEQGNYVEASAVDRANRLYSYRALKAYPLVVLMDTSEAGALADHQHRQTIYVLATSLISAILMGLGIFALMRIASAYRQHKGHERSERRLNDAQRLAKIGAWELDLVRAQLTWSDEIYQIFEIDRTKLSPSYDAFLNVIHPDDRAAVNTAYTNSLGNRTPYSIQHRLLMPDGRIKYIHERCETTFSSTGVPLRSHGTAQDVTKHTLAQIALQESQSLLSSIIESAMDAIITVNASGQILVFNRAAETIFRCKAGNAIGQPLERFIPKRFRAIHAKHMDWFAVSGTILPRSGRPRVVTGLRADGEEFPFEATIAATRSDSGVLLTVMLRDIEGRIAAAEAQRDTLVREVHHRIKNNLQGVVGLARTHLVQHPELAAMAQSLIREVGVISMVHGMHSEQTNGDITLCEMATQISHAAMAINSARIDVDVMTDKLDSIRISKDEAVPLALVLNELLANAIKHCGRNAEGVIRVGVSVAAGQARVDISGPGTLPADFDFAADKGLGTGLSLVKSLLPRRGAKLQIRQDSDQVVATVLLDEPAIQLDSALR